MASGEADWKFSQCFGDKAAAEVDDLTDADILSAVEFDQSGDYLATGDKGGRIVIFHRDNAAASSSMGGYKKPGGKLGEYSFYTEFQSHEPEFDYLKVSHPFCRRHMLHALLVCGVFGGARYLWQAVSCGVPRCPCRRAAVARTRNCHSHRAALQHTTHAKPALCCTGCGHGAVAPAARRCAMPPAATVHHSAPYFRVSFLHPMPDAKKNKIRVCHHPRRDNKQQITRARRFPLDLLFILVA